MVYLICTYIDGDIKKSEIPIHKITKSYIVKFMYALNLYFDALLSHLSIIENQSCRLTLMFIGTPCMNLVAVLDTVCLKKTFQ